MIRKYHLQRPVREKCAVHTTMGKKSVLQSPPSVHWWSPVLFSKPIPYRDPVGEPQLSRDTSSNHTLRRPEPLGASLVLAGFSSKEYFKSKKQLSVGLSSFPTIPVAITPIYMERVLKRETVPGEHTMFKEHKVLHRE